MKLVRHAKFDAQRDWTGDFLDLQRAVVEAEGDFSAVVQAVLDAALRFLPQASGALIAMRNGDSLDILAGAGVGSLWCGQALPIDGSLAGRAVMSRELQSSGDVGGDGRLHGSIYLGRDVCSVMAVPLVHGGEVAAVLGIQSPLRDAFVERDHLLVQLLAGPIVIGLSNRSAADEQRARLVADRRFEATFAHAPVGIAHVQPDGKFLRVNDRFGAITGWPCDHLLVHGFQHITHPEDLEADLAHVRRLLTGEDERYSMEKRYLRPDGSSVWVNLTVSLVRDADGQPEFFVSVIEDLSEIKRAQAEALRDPLTGLLNRRGAIERIRRETARATRRHGRFGIIYLDLDGFKAINDRHGHAAGDACLIDIARAIGTAIRSGGAAARVGGDEFVVVVGGVGAAGLARAAGRMRTAIRRASAAADWSVSASIGGLCWSEGDEEDPESLIAEADRAMFRAKQAGKDRAVILGEAD